MNSYINETNTGCSIRPSPRRSIHDSCNKCNCKETMGKYGLEKSKREHISQPSGVDDVDNVMSKMYYSKSPSQNPIHNISGSHSSNFSDDLEDYDDSDDGLCVTTSENILERSASESYNASNNINLSRNVYNNETFRSKSINTEKRSNNLCSKLIYILLPIIFCGLGLTYYQRLESHEIDVYDKFSFYNDVKDIGEKYKIQDNSILKVKIGISTIFEKQDTGSFIFIYDSKVNNFNPSNLDQFVEDISAKSSKYLRNDTKKGQHVIVNPSNLIVHTEKEFMNRYQNELDKWGVMLVKDVDNIPSHLAMAFHYYCDEYNPLVKKSAIFFTLNLANCSNGSKRKSTHEYVEKCLARKWNSVEQDKIGPLLTRVVNVVVDVTSI